jgi:hypothetical protein
VEVAVKPQRKFNAVISGKPDFHNDWGKPLNALTAALCMVWMLAAGADAAQREVVEIDSLEQLTELAGKSGNTVRMKPGVYRLIDHIPLRQIAERTKAARWHFLEFSGNDNAFDLTDVTIEVDTRLRAALRAPIHNPEFLVSGANNVLSGLTVTNLGDGTSSGGSVFSVRGERNTLRDVTLHVRGSSPYGYGDLFGKGGGAVIGHRKHSGLQVTGDHTRLIGCRIYMRSFGHGFYVQGATDVHFEDCCVEGEMRSTDDMLSETSGRAYEVGFRSVYRNREGQWRVTPGYMKSLAEDGFRIYENTTDVTLLNCTAKNMRAGFELRGHSRVRIENCAAIGNERGFWVGDQAVIRNSRGDAQFGPLLFLEGSNASVDLELMPAESPMKVHALATIYGVGHEVTLRPWKGEQRSHPLPIKIGFAPPGGGEGMSPYSERPARNIELQNQTNMPVIGGD